MKKFLCVILCLSMLMSFAGIAGATSIDAVNEGGFSLGTIDGEEAFAGALNSFNSAGIEVDVAEINELSAAGAFDDVQTLFVWEKEGSPFKSEGDYVADFMYNTSIDLMWGNHISYVDTKGTETTDDDVVVNSKGDVSLTYSNVNVHLKRILNEKYGGQKLFLKSASGEDADDYASAIASFIHNIINPTEGYEKVAINFPGTEAVSSDDFYSAIVEASGLGNVLQYNWCNQTNMNFKPVLYVLGIDFDNILDSEYKDGLRLGKKIVRYAIEKILNVGPINYLMDVIWAYSRTYHISLAKPTLALLNRRINARFADTTKPEITVEELETTTGLLNLLFNDADSTDTTKYQFMPLPAIRLGSAANTAELFLYILTYLNMNVKYKNNKQVVEGFDSLSKVFNDDAVFTSFFDSLVLGDYKLKDGTPAESIDAFVMGYSDMYKETIDNAGEDIWNSLMRTLERLLKAIADYFDNLFKIITGEKEFGKA